MAKFTAIKVIYMWFILQGCTVTSVEGAAPVLIELPIELYVGETETGSRLMHTFAIQDPNGDSFSVADAITAEKTGAAVAGTYDQFEIKLNALSGQYELWTTGLTAFDYATVDKFFNTLTATDTNSEASVPLDIEVNVVEGERITINNAEGSANYLNLSALSIGQEVEVKTISASSALGSEIEFSIVSDPSFEPEFFTIDRSRGIIKTNRELKYLNTTNPSVKLTIEAYDRKNQIKVYATQTVYLKDQNTLPTATNMINGLAETKVETLTAGTVLFTVSTSDPDTSQIHSYRYTCDKPALEDTFTIDSNGQFMIATGKTLDYERFPSIICDFYIHDGIDEGGPFTYTLTVDNDNEAPVFSNTMYYVSAYEASKGSVTFDPKFVVTDEDAGDSITYQFQAINNSDRFTVNSAGLITFNTDYDVDNGAMTGTAVLTVYAIDSGHIDGESLTATAQVTIVVSDINDNDPIIPFTSYSFIVTDTTDPGSVIGSIAPTDIDSGSNGEVMCAASSGSSYSSYYAVGYNCQVYLNKQVDFATGTQTQYVVVAKDNGNPSRSTSTTVDIIYQQTPTTTTTTAATTTPYNFFDHGGNIALFIFALLMALALLGALTWCCINMCCPNACGGACRNICDCKCFDRGYEKRDRRSQARQRPETPDTPPPKYNRKWP